MLVPKHPVPKRQGIQTVASDKMYVGDEVKSPMLGEETRVV